MSFEVMGFAEKKVKKFLEKNLLPSRFYQRNTARRISRITLFAPFMIESLSTDTNELLRNIIGKKILYS